MCEVPKTLDLRQKARNQHQPQEDGGGPAVARARFLRAERLRRRQDYLRVQAEGRKFQTTHFAIWLAPGAKPHPRLGLVVGRKIGKASRRNRVKRLVREFFRRHKHQLPPKEVIILAKKGSPDLTYEEVVAELAKILLSRPQEE